MKYLVHHEFGLDFKIFKFQKNFETKYDHKNINFWLSYWIYVYENVLHNFKKSSNIQYLAYEDFNVKLDLILKKFKLNLPLSHEYQFKNKNNFENIKNIKFDENLKIKAKNIYRELEKLQIN